MRLGKSLSSRHFVPNVTYPLSPLFFRLRPADLRPFRTMLRLPDQGIRRCLRRNMFANFCLSWDRILPISRFRRDFSTDHQTANPSPSSRSQDPPIGSSHPPSTDQTEHLISGYISSGGHYSAAFSAPPTLQQEEPPDKYEFLLPPFPLYVSFFFFVFKII